MCTGHRFQLLSALRTGRSLGATAFSWLGATELGECHRRLHAELSSLALAKQMFSSFLYVHHASRVAPLLIEQIAISLGGVCRNSFRVTFHMAKKTAKQLKAAAQLAKLNKDNSKASSKAPTGGVSVSSLQVILLLMHQTVA